MPFDPPSNMKNKKKKKKKKLEILSSYTCVLQMTIIYDVQFLRYGAQQKKFFVILNHFLPYYAPPLSPNKLENHNFEKMKKNAWILSLYTSVPKIMISRDMVHDRQTDRQADWQRDWRTDRKTDELMNGQTDGQTDRQTRPFNEYFVCER